MSRDWWPSVHSLRSVNPVWGHRVCNGRDLHGSAGSGRQRDGAGGLAKWAIVLPPGAAPDRLGASGQIWEGNVHRGAWEGPAVRQPHRSSSRAASQNSLLMTNLQTSGKSSSWPSANAHVTFFFFLIFPSLHWA